MAYNTFKIKNGGTFVKEIDVQDVHVKAIGTSFIHPEQELP